MNSIRVVSIDNHPCTRRGIAIFLSSYPDLELVGTAATGREGLDLCKQAQPDVVLIEPKLPDEDGMVVIRTILSGRAQTSVLVFSAFSDAFKLKAALQAGAMGYLTKDISPDELAKAIRDACAGHPAMSGRARHTLLRAVFNPQAESTATATARNIPLVAHAPGAQGGLHALSERELEVARLVGEGLSNKQIAQQLILSTATVKCHMKHIQAKLGARGRIHVVHLAHQHRYREQAWS